MNDYSRFKIQSYDLWDLFVNTQQQYLGRCYLWAKRDGDFDIFDMACDEKEEFFNIGMSVKVALTKLFNPSRFNYANLQNASNHLHVHIIPRYNDQREFDGLIFTDKNKGRNYAPYDKSFQVPEITVLKIRDAIHRTLQDLFRVD